MKTITLRRINFLSFIKLSMTTGIAIGWFLGVLSLIASLFGGPAAANIFGLQFRGIAGGLINVIWVPIVFGVGLGFLSIFGYWPFLWLLRGIGGLRVGLEADESVRPVREREPALTV
jgi:hypothetical protein